MKPPIIILDHPQMGENIGAAARAMGNFGLTDLRLVAPRDGWPNPKATIMASHATHILDNAKVYDTFAEAVHDCQVVYATTSRERDMAKPIVTPRYAAASMTQNDAIIQSAIVFGAERTGLENEPIALSDAMIVIPVSKEYASMNLAQAVVICAYEWFVASTESSWHAHVDPTADVRATKEELEGLFGHLETKLTDHGYFRTDPIRPHMIRNIRTMLTRAAFTAQEVRTFRGIIRALAGDDKVMRDL